jgi:D-erythronate 2-dehydrogenase
VQVLITGAAGFLGRRLTQALLQRGVLTGPADRPEAIEHLILVDIEEVPRHDDARVVSAVCDVGNDLLLDALIGPQTSAIFHLSAVVSGQAEADFDLGMRVNVDATRTLLEVCRRRGHVPRVVFSSSVAVYGGALPDVVDDSTILAPQTSYGTEKAIAELLINDYTRRGFIDGRALRLPTICVRPGRPNSALSSFVSGLIREPLRGETTVCPVTPETPMWVLSPGAVTQSFIAAHELRGEALGAQRSLILPGLSVTMGEMAAALARVAGPEVAARIRWEPDPRVQRIASTWPRCLDHARARALGFRPDASIDAIIRQHQANDPSPLDRP